MALREASLCFLILMAVVKRFFPQVSSLLLLCLAYFFPVFFFFFFSMLHSGVPQITSSVILNEVGLNLTSFVGLMQAYLRIIHSFVWLIVFHFSLCSLEGP